MYHELISILNECIMYNINNNILLKHVELDSFMIHFKGLELLYYYDYELHFYRR